VPATEARALGEDEFWHDDLVGCVVVTDRGQEVGTVTEVVAGPAQDRLEVDTPRGPRFVPMVKEIVISVDRDAKRIVIAPPEGLFD
jgi:16S rRNA processing protein RimM